MRHAVSTSFIFSSAILFSFACNAEPCRISNSHANIVSGTKILIHTEECPDSARRVVRIFVHRGSEPPQALLRRTQRLSESAFGSARFIDLENDGVPEVELTGSCNAPNCERNIFKLSEDEKSMYHYYEGGYSSIRRTANYLVTDSYGSYSSWEYLAYDPSSQTYPLRNFHYSVFVSSGNVSNELVCKISELAPNGNLKRVDSPPQELLKFCRHYGEDIPVKILNFEKNKKSVHGKKPAP